MQPSAPHPVVVVSGTPTSRWLDPARSILYTMSPLPAFLGRPTMNHAAAPCGGEPLTDPHTIYHHPIAHV